MAAFYASKALKRQFGDFEHSAIHTNKTHVTFSHYCFIMKSKGRRN